MNEARDFIAEALGNVKTLLFYDTNDLQSTAVDNIPEIIYYNDAERVIQDYESSFWREAEERVSDASYTAGDWRDAQMTWANTLYYCAMEAEIAEAVNELDDEIDSFRNAVESLGGDPDDARFCTTCSYGWTPHNYEDEDGTMFWNDKRDVPFAYNPELLEGELWAVSKPLKCGLYLELAWRPEHLDNDDDDTDSRPVPENRKTTPLGVIRTA